MTFDPRVEWKSGVRCRKRAPRFLTFAVLGPEAQTRRRAAEVRRSLKTQVGKEFAFVLYKVLLLI